MPTQFAVRVRTGDPDEARLGVAESYCPHGLTLRGRADGFAARHAEAGSGSVRVFDLEYGSTDVQVTPVPFAEFVLVSRPLIGRLVVRGQGRERLVATNEVVALDALTRYELGFEQGCRLITMRIRRAAVDVAAGAALGLEGPTRLRFALDTPPGAPARQTWDAVSRFLLDEPAGAGPLLAGQIERMVAAALVECFPAMPTHRPTRVAAAGRAAVERAVAFVEHAAGEDIGLAEMAAAAGVSPRALQLAFRRHLDRTPTEHLRRVRLDGVRDDLLSAPPGTTVAAVAHRWGFGNLGRFAVEYRRRFGRLPRHDLHG